MVCNIFFGLQCNFPENKAINVMHDQPGLAKIEFSSNLKRTALHSRGNRDGGGGGNSPLFRHE